MEQFKSRVELIFNNLKHNLPTVTSPYIPVTNNLRVVANLRIISQQSLKGTQDIDLLYSWRQKNQRWFPSQFKVTLSGTKKWAHTRLIENPERILFIIEDLEGKSVGHIGLNRFDWKNRSCEIDNVIRGKKIHPGMMSYALKALINWSYQTLRLKGLTLRVFADNKRALNFYKRLGFKEVQKIPLQKIVDKHSIRWEVTTNSQQIKRYLVEMKHMLKL